MAMNLQTISRWLDEEDTNHHYDEEKGLIVFGAKGDVQTSHWIRLKEDGEMFSYQVQLRVGDENFSVPKGHKNELVLLQYLLHENYTTKFGCWEYDYTDGDIRFSVEIPLEDSELTKKQFERINSLTRGNVDTVMGKIESVLETGEIPDDSESTDDLLKKLLLLKAMEEGLIGDDKSSKKKPNADDIDDDDGI